VTKVLSARDKEAIRSNNARESLNIIKKYNSKKLHNDTVRVRAQLTTPQKAKRVDAKKRKTMLKECAAMDDNELSDLFGELVASGDRTLSAGPLSTAPNTTLVRLENATIDRIVTMMTRRKE
jgi:hypothetical protein